MSRNSLSTNQELYKGDFLMSNNQQYKAMFQDDGNFVVYKWSQIWSTNTESGQAFRVVLQEDTNLVIYTKADQALWRTGCHTTTPRPRVRLTLTDDGHLITYDNGVQTWSS
uniref:Bulb-type lectin domain-containing protein n=1 Tax=Gadus morhua TaxID=8049 RepID=A0A8C4ZVU2_GADMO